MMASSGTITGSVTNKSGIFSFYLEWSAEQDIANNCSYVTVTSYFGTTNTAHRFDTYGTRPVSITINGVKSETYKRLVCNPWDSTKKYAIMSVTRQQVPHDSDGTKTITISASADGTANSGSEHYGPSYDSSQPCTASASVTLDAIQRFAYVTTAPEEIEDSGTYTIHYNNPLGTAISKLEAGVRVDSTTMAVPYRDVSISGTSYAFTFTQSETAALRNACTDNQTTAYFVLRSTYNSVTYTTTYETTLRITNSSETQPTVSLAISPNNGSLPSTFDGLYIQGKTKMSGTITASGKYGATIDSYEAGVLDEYFTTSTFLSGYLDSSGTTAAWATVTDSRGFTNSASASFTLLAYTKPQVVNKSGETEVRCYRSNSSGTEQGDATTIWLKAKKSYSPLTVSGTDKNTCRLRWRSRLATSQTYGSWTVLTTTDNEYSALLSGVFAATSSYVIQIGVIDDLSEESALTIDIPAFTPTVHLGADGDRIGVGRYAQDVAKTFSVASDWKSYFPGGLFAFLRGAEAVPYWEVFESPLVTLYNSGTPGFYPFIWGSDDAEWGAGIAIMGRETSSSASGTMKAAAITLGFGSLELNCYEIDSGGLSWLGYISLIQ